MSRDRNRLKRGGGFSRVALDFEVAESEYRPVGHGVDDTVDHFHIECLRSLLDLATGAILGAIVGYATQSFGQQPAKLPEPEASSLFASLSARQR